MKTAQPIIRLLPLIACNAPTSTGHINLGQTPHMARTWGGTPSSVTLPADKRVMLDSSATAQNCTYLASSDTVQGVTGAYWNDKLRKSSRLRCRKRLTPRVLKLTALSAVLCRSAKRWKPR